MSLEETARELAKKYGDFPKNAMKAERWAMDNFYNELTRLSENEPALFPKMANTYYHTYEFMKARANLDFKYSHLDSYLNQRYIIVAFAIEETLKRYDINYKRPIWLPEKVFNYGAGEKWE